MYREFNKRRNVWEKIPEVEDLGYDKKLLQNKTPQENLGVLHELQMLFCVGDNLPKTMHKTVVEKFNVVEEFEKLKNG